MEHGRVLRAAHFGLTVSSLEEAIVFWRDVLGFELTARRNLGSGAAMENIVGVPGADLEIAIVTGPDGLKIELLEYREPENRHIYRPRSCDVGSVHLALEVSDLDAMLERIEPAGWRSLGVPQTLASGIRVMYVRGPEGHTIEFMQPAAAAEVA